MQALEARLGLPAVVAISIASMLGSGIFVLPGVAVWLAHEDLWLAYLIAALCTIPAAISKSELATAMPSSGGAYVYLDRTFGPLVGTVVGLGLWVSLLLKTAFALIGIGTYLVVLAAFPLKTVALTLLALVVLLNILGVGKVSGALIFAVICSMGALLVLCVMAAFNYEPSLARLTMNEDSRSLLSAAGLVFMSYSGVIKVAAIAEEIKKPEKNIPKGILFSVGVVAVIYCLVTHLLVGVVDINTMDLKPIYQMAQAVGHPTFALVIAGIAILAMASMGNAGLLAASRFPFAMARDHLLPSMFGQLSNRFLTPHWSILISGVMVALCILYLDVTKIAKLASSFMIMVYLLANLAVIVLRENRVQWYQPKYKSPFYPYLQIVGILCLLVLLFLMGTTAVIGLAVIGVPGLLIFVFYSRLRMERRGVVAIRSKRSELMENEEGIQTSLFESAKVVVSLFGKEKSPETLIEMAVSLSDGDKVEVAHLTEVPEQSQLSDFRRDTPWVRSLRRRIRALAKEKKVRIAFDPIVSHDIYKTVYDISDRVHCTWLVKEWGGRTRGTFTLHHQMGWLEDHLKCNVLTFRDRGVRYIKRILVHITEGIHEELILDTVNHLAQVYGAQVVFSSFQGGRSPESMLRLKEGCSSCTEVLEIAGNNEVEEVASLSAEFDLLVLEAQDKSALQARFFGTKQDRMIERSGCSVVAVQGYYPT